MRNISIELTQKLFTAQNPSIGWLAISDWAHGLDCEAFYFFYEMDGELQSRCTDCYSVEINPEISLDFLRSVNDNTLYGSATDDLSQEAMAFFGHLLQQEAIKFRLAKWPEYKSSSPMAAYAVPSTVGAIKSMMILTSHKGPRFLEKLLKADGHGISSAMTYAQRWHIIQERKHASRPQA